MNHARKLKIGTISVFIAFAIGVSGWLILNSSLIQPTKLIIPKTSWERLFFQGIDETTKLASLQKLREKRLPINSIEIRIWEGFGLENLEAVIFSKSNNKWRAYHVVSNDHFLPTKASFLEVSRRPKSGWESFTRELVSLDIFDLPDAEAIGCEINELDGRSYVVEILRNNTYRTYRYNSRAGGKCNEGKKLQRIVELVADEFENKLQDCTGTQ